MVLIRRAMKLHMMYRLYAVWLLASWRSTLSWLGWSLKRLSCWRNMDVPQRS